MFDRDLALALLRQIDQAADTIQSRTRELHSADDLLDTPAGRERLDGVCMRFMAIGWFTLGQDTRGVLVAVSHTYRITGPASACLRIISARKATPREQRFYEEDPR